MNSQPFCNMKRIRSYIIGFSKTEANASIILVAIIILAAIAPRMYIRYAYSGEKIDFGSKDELKAWHEEVRRSFVKKQNKSKIIERKLFAFDPNVSSVEVLISLGFKPYVAKRIGKYRSTGGIFKSSEDLKKNYGVDSKLVEELSNYIKITPTISSHKKEKEWLSSTHLKNPAPRKRESKPVDINSATQKDLEQLKGIDPYFAKCIIKYRKALGSIS